MTARNQLDGITLASREARPPTTAPVLLEGRALACQRGERMLFRGLDLTVHAGELVQIHGPNGSGKTTLLRILCGLTRPTEGEVRWVAEEPDAAGLEADVHYVGHLAGVKLELSPLENLAFVARLRGGRAGASPRDALARLGLAAFEDEPLRTLSAGQRRRTALARLLTRVARLWILDEPFTSLDVEGTATLVELMDEHVARGGAVILTSHQPVRLGDRGPRMIELGR
ncbi:MAG: cytochrome c biogenesis heme-transporting ATPase CcmA [Ectothiorhodospiraceae bacterium]|nr:cytochrome c biogenesis heme-transporting ATPase CcmA [Ectothiorhodospiraceae bacterium]